MAFFNNLSPGAQTGMNIGMGAAQGAAGGGLRGAFQGAGMAGLSQIPVAGPMLSGALGGYLGGSNEAQSGLNPEAVKAMKQRGLQAKTVKPPGALKKKGSALRGIAVAGLGVINPALGIAASAANQAYTKKVMQKYGKKVQAAGAANQGALANTVRNQQAAVAQRGAPQMAATAPMGKGLPGMTPGAMPGGMPGGAPGMPPAMAARPGAAPSPPSPTMARQPGQQLPNLPTGAPNYAGMPTRDINENLSAYTSQLLANQLAQGLDPRIESGLYQAATQGAQTARQGLSDTFGRSGDTSGYNYGISTGIDMSLGQQLAGIHPAFLQQQQEYMNNLLFNTRGTIPGAVAPGGSGGGGNLAGILSGVGGLASGIGSLYSSMGPRTAAAPPNQMPSTNNPYGGYR